MKKRGYDMSLLNDIIDALRQGKTLAEKSQVHNPV